MALQRISPGVYRDTATGRTVNSTNGKAPAARPNAQRPNAPRPMAGPFAGLPKGQRQLLNREKIVQDYQTRQNVGLANPNTFNPFGSQTVTFDEQGNPIVNQSLSQGQQGILERDTGLSTMGRDLAIQRFGQGAYGQEFNPQLAARTSTGDLNADRARIEDEVFGRLTRTTNRDFDRERQQMEQDLYNRGIPMEQWQNRPEMQALNERYDTLRQNARAQATELGGQEMSRSFGQNEQLIANQLSQQQGIRNQNLGELGTFAGFGTGLQVPNFQAYQGPQAQYSNPTQIGLSKEELEIRRRAASNAMKAMSGGGGGAADSSPFYNSPPPGL